jgi:hypothetical protein
MVHKRKALIRIAAALPPEPRPKRFTVRIVEARSPSLKGSIVVSVADGKRAPAARSAYHEIGPDLEPREDVYRIRDMGCDGWSDSLSVILSPSHDCRLPDLVHGVVDRLEERLDRSLGMGGMGAPGHRPAARAPGDPGDG